MKNMTKQIDNKNSSIRKNYKLSNMYGIQDYLVAHNGRLGGLSKAFFFVVNSESFPGHQ